MNGHKKQSINSKGANTKTEYQLNIENTDPSSISYLLESMGLCMGGKNQRELRSQRYDSNIQMRAVKESDYSKTNFQ